MSNLTTVRKEGNKRCVYKLQYFIARKIKDKYTQKSCVFVVVIFYKDKNFLSFLMVLSRSTFSGRIKDAQVP